MMAPGVGRDIAADYGERQPTGHGQGDHALGGWDKRSPSGPSGFAPGTSGNRRIFWTCVGLALLVACICTVNVFTILDDAEKMGRAVVPWKIWAAEYSSMASSISILPLVVLIERAASAGAWPRRVALLLGGSLLYSALHVSIMVALRHIVWWLMGDRYNFDVGGEFFYEYRKDAVAYAVVIAALFVARRWPGQQPATAEAPPPRPSVVQLTDGSRSISVDIADLTAVLGGGNYVELVHEDGRKRMLRATLGATEAALNGHGFRRTHKSWLVRLAAVRRIERTGAGDYRLTLAGGLVAPLSRRMSGVVKELRAAEEAGAIGLARPSSAS